MIPPVSPNIYFYSSIPSQFGLFRSQFLSDNLGRLFSLSVGNVFLHRVFGGGCLVFCIFHASGVLNMKYSNWFKVHAVLTDCGEFGRAADTPGAFFNQLTKHTPFCPFLRFQCIQTIARSGNRRPAGGLHVRVRLLPRHVGVRAPEARVRHNQAPMTFASPQIPPDFFGGGGYVRVPSIPTSVEYPQPPPPGSPQLASFIVRLG